MVAADWREKEKALVTDERRRTAPLLLRLTEVAEQLGLGRSTVCQLLQRGDLPCVRIGRSVRVPADALAEWVRERVETPETRPGAGLES